MFWGLIMEPQKRYSQTVKKSFHVSMAALDLCSSTSDPVQIMCGFENRKYLLCTLKKEDTLQCALDLNFEVGDEVSFVTNGASHVHLTGYLNDEFDQDVDEEEEEDAALLDQLGNISASNITSAKRPSKVPSDEIQLNGLASAVKKRLALGSGSPSKKSKTLLLLDEAADEEDSDDSDIDLSAELEDDEDISMLEEEDDDDDDMDGSDEEAEEEEDDDEEAEEEESDDDEEEPTPPSPWTTMNGTSKKQKPDGTKKEVLTPSKKGKKDTNTEAKTEKQTPKKDTQQSPKKELQQKKTIEGGVIIEDLKQGTGPVAKSGKMVQVFYEGRLKNNNKMFDSSTKGNGFKFRLGRQEVIKGWDVGVSGMKVGGKRRIVCPPNMAYGQKGSPPTIPPNSTLVFEVELKKIN